jgi:hypothetical protein
MERSLRGTYLDGAPSFPDICVVDADLYPDNRRERREHDIYRQLLQLSPSLEEKLCNGTEDDIFQAAELVSLGTDSLPYTVTANFYSLAKVHRQLRLTILRD